jgi:hypothetical protein
VIAEYLNRGVVLDLLSQVVLEARSDIARLIADGGTSEPEDQALLSELQAAETRERRRSSGQEGFDPTTASRRGHEPAPLDDYSFFSRDPIISLLQSALDEHSALIHPDDAIDAPPPDDDRRGGADEIVVTDRRLRRAPPLRRSADGRRVFDKFSITDIRWVRAKVAEGIRCFRGKRAFNEHSAPVCDMPERARLLLVGDWATGLPRARKVAARMRGVLDEGQAGGLVQHVIHLGDVYYSGWEHEFRRRFLPHWPVAPGEAIAIGSWCVNANHDMYSGGHGYYDVLLADARFHRQHQSSFFSLVNAHWKVLGLDTAWDEGQLRAPQPQWLDDEMRGERRRVILLSHHPRFSAYGGCSEPLRTVTRPFLERQPVTAWFWGHEHRCVLYHPFENVEAGRCVGHGGVPVYMWRREGDPYPPPAAYEYREYIRKGLERWALLGFAVLDFDGPSLEVRYIDENGREHRRESLG